MRLILLSDARNTIITKLYLYERIYCPDYSKDSQIPVDRDRGAQSLKSLSNSDENRNTHSMTLSINQLQKRLLHSFYPDYNKIKN